MEIKSILGEPEQGGIEDESDFDFPTHADSTNRRGPVKHIPKGIEIVTWEDLLRRLQGSDEEFVGT